MRSMVPQTRYLAQAEWVGAGDFHDKAQTSVGTRAQQGQCKITQLRQCTTQSALAWVPTSDHMIPQAVLNLRLGGAGLRNFMVVHNSSTLLAALLLPSPAAHAMEACTRMVDGHATYKYPSNA